MAILQSTVPQSLKTSAVLPLASPKLQDLHDLKAIHDFNWDELQKALNDRLIGREYFQNIFSTHQSLMPTTIHDLTPEGSFSVKGSRKGWYFTGDMRYAAYKKHIEDVKGVKTAVYRLKKRLMWHLYRIKIEEV